MEQGAGRTDRTPAWTIIVHEEAAEDGGGFWAEITELPGSYASGDGLDELREDLAAAIDSHIATLQEAGLAVPPLFLIPRSAVPGQKV